MQRTSTLFFTILAVIIGNVVWSQTETCFQNLDDPDFRTLSQISEQDTIYREYILKLPISYDENKPTPLIINFHGFGDCASDYSETIGAFYNFNTLANTENIIVAYPQGAFRSEKQDTYWEPGDSENENIYENDIYFIDQLITDISTRYNVNPEMIYACGYSNGGMMTYSLACNRSNIFSAIGIMSGTMLEEDCTLERSIPIIKFHGIADGVLPYNGNSWYQSVEEVVTFWLELNNIPVNSLSSFQLNEGNVSLEQYTDNNRCLSLYTINEEYDKPGDHVWFSDDIDGVSPNQLMWNFFQDNCGSINSTDNNEDIKYHLYPNPAKFELQIDNAINQPMHLFDLNGQLIIKQQLKSNSETINLQDLQAGFYTIRIGEQIEKLLKID